MGFQPPQPVWGEKDEDTTLTESSSDSQKAAIRPAAERLEEWQNRWNNSEHFQTLIKKIEELLDNVTTIGARAQEWKDECSAECSLVSVTDPDRFLGVICFSRDQELLEEVAERYQSQGYDVEQVHAEVDITFR